ncbi:MAG: 5'-methylthioadenosine/S-adenosylhomocysteine nucleosidase [Acholeplasmataceae bacterium]|nr:5'-methylthioadenosine/S-adenosylhomocysteine nucleosidase [Acholeplasmataceae bacterium]
MKLIIGAMDDELNLLINHLEQKEKLNTITTSYKGILENQEVVISITGVGKVNAASSLAELLTKYQFQEIINIGLAGASHHFTIGEMVEVSSAIQYDFDINYFGYQKGEIPKYPNPFKPYKIKTNLKQTLLLTQDRFETTKLPLDKPYLVDMEGAALFQVAHKFKVNLVSFKYVSDIVGSKGQTYDYQQSEKIDGKKVIYDFLISYLKG